MAYKQDTQYCVYTITARDTDFNVRHVYVMGYFRMILVRVMFEILSILPYKQDPQIRHEIASILLLPEM